MYGNTASIKGTMTLTTNDLSQIRGYFNETWCEDTFGQYTQSFFDFRDLTYFVAYRWPS
jgi:dTDP-4-dehydrorhamnose 3,5-epimerase-like enzyme